MVEPISGFCAPNGNADDLAVPKPCVAMVILVIQFSGIGGSRRSVFSGGFSS